MGAVCTYVIDAVNKKLWTEPNLEVEKPVQLTLGCFVTVSPEIAQHREECNKL